MRVIAGRFKGRRLKTPTWKGLRPTSDNLRETLFNILAPRIEGARVLDGFAGTGAVGIEALSRGAAHVTFVDTDRRALALIEHNVAACGVRDGYTIERGTMAAVANKLTAPAFDVIVLDPPYDTTDMATALDAAARCLAPNGVLVLERATQREPAMSACLVRVRDVRHGDSTLTFFARGANSGSPGGAEGPAQQESR